jgi:GNAT superfamily N-acetyltransferase
MKCAKMSEGLKKTRRTPPFGTIEMDEVLIEQMTQLDLERLSAIYLSAFETIAADEHWTIESARALVEHWWRRQPDLAYVARIDNQPIAAFIVGVKPWWDGNHLVEGELFVDSAWQSRGIGSRLLRQVLNVAMEKYSAVVWETHTFRGNDFPLSWYKKLGFIEIEEWVMIRADVSAVVHKLS